MSLCSTIQVIETSAQVKQLRDQESCKELNRLLSEACKALASNSSIFAVKEHTWCMVKLTGDGCVSSTHYASHSLFSQTIATATSRWSSRLLVIELLKLASDKHRVVLKKMSVFSHPYVPGTLVEDLGAIGAVVEECLNLHQLVMILHEGMGGVMAEGYQVCTKVMDKHVMICCRGVITHLDT